MTIQKLPSGNYRVLFGRSIGGKKTTVYDEIFEKYGDAKKAEVAFKKSPAAIGTQEIFTKSVLTARTNLDNFVKNWIEENISKYKASQYDNFKTDLMKATTKHVDQNPSIFKIKPVGSTSFSPFKTFEGETFPNIRSTRPDTGYLTGKKIPFKIYGLTATSSGSVADETSRLNAFFKKIFFTGQLKNKPQLKANIQKYIDWMIKRKPGGTGSAVKNYEAFKSVATPEVMAIFDEMSGPGKAKVMRPLFKNYDAFLKKTNMLTSSYQEMLKEAEQRLGIKPGTTYNTMTKERRFIKGVTGIKGEYAPSVHHIHGLRAALDSGNKQKIIESLKAVTVVPKVKNIEMGWGYESFEQNKNRLKNEFKLATTQGERRIIVNKLNTAAKAADANLIFSATGDKLNQKATISHSTPYKRTKFFMDKLLKDPKFFKSESFTNLPIEKQTQYLSMQKGETQATNIFFTNLKKSIKKLSKTEKLEYCSMLSKGGLPGNCAQAINANPVKTAEIFSKAEAGSGAMAKVKNAATGFLGLLGKGGMKAAPLAAVAAAGAIAEPLVKQFRNDDPTTYMTDENQQKGVLLSLLESETPQVDEEILKWQHPGQIAGAAAAIPGSGDVYKARRLPFKSVKRGIDRAAMGVPRAALGPVGKFLAGSFSPLGVAASLPIGIAAQVKGGSEIEDIATDPMNWLGPAFASSGAKMATRGMAPTGILSKALRMGMSPKTLRLISSRFGLPGLALSAGLTGYDWWKNRQYK